MPTCYSLACSSSAFLFTACSVLYSPLPIPAPASLTHPAVFRGTESLFTSCVVSVGRCVIDAQECDQYNVIFCKFFKDKDSSVPKILFWSILYIKFIHFHKIMVTLASCCLNHNLFLFFHSEIIFSLTIPVLRHFRHFFYWSQCRTFAVQGWQVSSSLGFLFSPQYCRSSWLSCSY